MIYQWNKTGLRSFKTYPDGPGKIWDHIISWLGGSQVIFWYPQNHPVVMDGHGDDWGSRPLSSFSRCCWPFFRSRLKKGRRRVVHLFGWVKSGWDATFFSYLAFERMVNIIFHNFPNLGCVLEFQNSQTNPFGVYDISIDQQYLNALRPTKSKGSLERWTGKEVSEAAKAPRAGGMEPEGAGVCRFLQQKNGPWRCLTQPQNGDAFQDFWGCLIERSQRKNWNCNQTDRGLDPKFQSFLYTWRQTYFGNIIWKDVVGKAPEHWKRLKGSDNRGKFDGWTSSNHQFPSVTGHLGI